MIKISPLKIEEMIIYDSILNHREIIGYLGWLPYKEKMKNKIRQTGNTIWGATYDDKPAGCMMVAGRNQVHFAKFGEVGVLPEFRRKRIATALYSAIIFQQLLEGRRLWEDTIVGTNPFQHNVLPTLGLELFGILKKKTASFLDIAIYGLNLKDDTAEKLLERVGECEIILTDDYYNRDIKKKNIDIYTKKNPSFIPILEKNIQDIMNSDKVIIQKGLDKPIHNAGKRKNRQLTMNMEN